MSHISDKSVLPSVPGQAEFVEKWLMGSQRKTAFALRQNCEAMIAGHSRRKLVSVKLGDGTAQKMWLSDSPENLNCTGFLTLTVGDVRDGRFCQVFDAAEASRRINNLNRRILPELFERAIVVTERHKSGAIHFHVLGVLRGRPDIRTGFDFEAFSEFRRRGTRFSAADIGASPELAQIWKNLRQVLPHYGFGRSELTPIRKTSEAVACYISKYIEKNVCNRLPEDRRKKLVRYIGWEKSQLKPNEFSWGTKRAIAWRGKARHMAALVGIDEKEDMAKAFGSRWAHRCMALWRGVTGDDLVPSLVGGFSEIELLRAELVRIMGIHAAERQGERRRFRFAGEIAEVKAMADNGWRSEFCPLDKPVPKLIYEKGPCRRPHWRITYKKTENAAVSSLAV